MYHERDAKMDVEREQSNYADPRARGSMAGSVGGSGRVNTQSELEYAVQRINEAIAIAHDRMDVLDMRLQPVKQDLPTTQSNSLDKASREVYSPAARDLVSFAERIEALNRKISSATDALAL